MCKKFLFMALLLCGACVAMAAEPFVWVEGEAATAQQNIVANGGLNSINPYAMAGGAWLSSFTEANMPTPGTADYAVTIPQDGQYHLWLRAVAGTGLGYRVDGGDWAYIDGNKGKDSESSSADGGLWWPPMIAWFQPATLMLTAGKHTIGIQFGGAKLDGKAAFAGLDCFALTTGDFQPNGRYKPDEQAPAVVQDIPAGKGWNFGPSPDALDPAAVLDLRYLNEKAAGETGFVHLSKDGNSFVRGDGQAIRFWATGDSPDGLTFAQLKHQAQFLAKRGVNIIRLHVQLAPRDEGSQVTDIDAGTLDFIFRTEAAMKQAGIYTIISPYWGNAVTIRKSWGTMADAGQSASGLLFFEPTLQKGYRAWVKALYTQPNPYSPTKMKLADDAGVAIIQLQNENSLLFYDPDAFKGAVLDYFRHQYADFLTKKYGALDKVPWKDYNRGTSEMHYLSEWDKGLPGQPYLWDVSRAGMAKKGEWPGFIPFTADFTEFLSRTMYKFNADMVSYLHNDLGCKQLVSTDNWHGPDGLTQDAQYWTGSMADVIAKNTYTGGYHIGNNSGWQVLPDSCYSNVSMIKNPTQLPFNMKHPLGHPLMIPETAWVHPDIYQAEAPLMMAAQSCLTGFNIGFWFCAGEEEWCGNTVTKWSDMTPMQIGQFPAAALIFREGLVKEGAPAVYEERTLQDMWNRTTPLLSDETGFDDPNHSAGKNVSPASSVKSPVDQLAFLVGPVQVKFDGNPAKSKVLDMTKYIDRTKQIVRADTGQIVTDYGAGLYRVDAPMAQAVAGFLRAAGEQRLSDVTITCKNPYAVITVVPLDKQPIKKSAKVLVQIGTISRPTGWASKPVTLFMNKQPFDCLKLVSTGAMPWQVENADVTLTIDNGKLTKGLALDINGMATATPVTITAAGGKITVVVPPNTMYLVLTSAAAK